MKNANRHLACGTSILALLVGLVATPSAQAQTYRWLYSFAGEPDGALPYAALVGDPAGNLYGTTELGGSGASGGCGIVFKVSRTGSETVLHAFTGAPDGARPQAALVRDAAGNLYGTTQSGGDTSCGRAGGCGTVFKLDTTGTETVLYAFTGLPDGDEPVAALVRDPAGNLYGTTNVGGDASCGEFYGCGTVFKLDTNGTETVLYSFAGGTDGAYPSAAVARDAAGNLYGTTAYGGDLICNCGTVFKLDTTGKEKVLHTFTGGADGSGPTSALIEDASGNLYGTTYAGGGSTSCRNFGCGTLFKVGQTGTETVLHSFTGPPDGANPFAGLARDAAGNFYGTTYFGGDPTCGTREGCGTVFKLDGTGTETVLHNFHEGARGTYNPLAGLVRDAAGNLYGTTSAGGAHGQGTLFKLKP